MRPLEFGEIQGAAEAEHQRREGPGQQQLENRRDEPAQGRRVQFFESYEDGDDSAGGQHYPPDDHGRGLICRAGRDILRVKINP